MTFQKKVIRNAVQEKKAGQGRRIILAEGGEERTIRAAGRIVEEGFLEKVILVDSEEKIRSEAEKQGISAEDFEIVDPQKSSLRPYYATLYKELRKGKNLSRGAAEEMMANPIYFGAMMVRQKKADGLVAGALSATADVLRAALQIIKLAADVSVLSSCFIMESPDTSFGASGLMAFGDCAVVPQPTAEQLADIAVSTAGTFQRLVHTEAQVAMLSFSTRGSAKHSEIDKVSSAVELAKKKSSSLSIDGELQADAALVASVGQRKCPESSVAGRANVLIFPNLDAGNIGYKLVERLGKAHAYGPLLQGLSAPINDLSRGCNSEDIVTVAAITALQG